MDLGVINTIIGTRKIARNIANHASVSVSIWVDDTIPFLLKRVEDVTKSCEVVCIVVVSQITIENTVSVFHITSCVDIKSDGAFSANPPNITIVSDSSSEG